MEDCGKEQLRVQLLDLLGKQHEVLEAQMLGSASDAELLEYEIRQEAIHDMCNELAHSVQV